MVGMKRLIEMLRAFLAGALGFEPRPYTFGECRASRYTKPLLKELPPEIKVSMMFTFLLIHIARTSNST